MSEPRTIIRRRAGPKHCSMHLLKSSHFWRRLPWTTFWKWY